MAIDVNKLMGAHREALSKARASFEANADLAAGKGVPIELKESSLAAVKNRLSALEREKQKSIDLFDAQIARYTAEAKRLEAAIESARKVETEKEPE